MSLEIEVKLAAQPEQINQIKQWFTSYSQHNLDWQQKQLVNTYYDTENHKLRELRIGLRIRRDSDNYIQSVKSEGRVVGGLFQRNESEITLPNANLDLLAVQDPYLQILLEEAEEEDGVMRSLFRTDFARTLAIIEVQGSEIEIALDQGLITHKDDERAISEVELELKSGEAKALFVLCEALIKEFNLVLSSESKAERGYRLCSNPSPYLKRLEVVALTAKSVAEGSFETIAHTGLSHWQHYIKQIKQQLTIDSVLQLNRALLFMQHLYSVFAPLIPRHSLKDVREDWREITVNFSKLMNVATQLNWLNNGKMYGFDFAELEPLEQKLKQEFEEQGQQFIAYLETAQYNQKYLHFSRWLYLKEWQESLKDSAKQKLQKEIFPFAIQQLQHQMLDISRHLKVKEQLNEKDYLNYLPKMYRTLDIGLFFGSLFDSKKRTGFRQHWVDLVANIELFKQLAFIDKALAQQSVTDKRLADTEQEILQTLKGMRAEAFEQNPYWN